MYDLELPEGRMGNVLVDYNSSIKGLAHIEFPMTVYRLYIGETNSDFSKSFWFLLPRCVGEVTVRAFYTCLMKCGMRS
jgi:hypothetical protein